MSARLAVAACAVFLLVLAPAARAGTPDASHCIVDHVIIGSFSTQGATSGPGPCTSPSQPGFDVWVRDLNNAPVPGAVVSVRFAGSGTGIKPYRVQNPGVTVDCSQRALSVVADASGHAVMVPRFGHFAQGVFVPVFADGQFIANVTARSPDYDGDGQISFLELNRMANDYFSPNYVPESDFDDCPATKLGDFVFFANEYLWDQGKPIEQVCP